MQRSFFPLLQTTFLKGPALAYFKDVIIRMAIGTDEDLLLTEYCFLDDRAKRVSDGVW